MRELLSIVTPIHKETKRDYLQRMNDDKVECMKIASKFGEEYWDGKRRFGYGGYRYIEDRQTPVASGLIRHYNLQEDAKILDVGCGKGFLLYEFQRLIPKSRVAGLDISEYAIKNSKPEIMSSLFVHLAQDFYPYDKNEFDLVISITTLHNLPINELKKALKEIERVGKERYIVVESYRNEKELFNLQCWALTAKSFYSPEEWKWLFQEFGYSGDYEFIYFE